MALSITRATAARNNASWCARVCRSHGLDTTVSERAWTSASRTPPYYPDAVTLTAELSVPELLAAIDPSPGCSIKDSFASLDLTDYGFHVLFDAKWIVRPPPVEQPEAPGTHWEVVRDEALFVRWELAWRGAGGPPDVLRADLIADESIAVLAARRGDAVEGGAVLSDAAGVVGISNVFSRTSAEPTDWVGCLALATALHPTSSLVGYESGEVLDLALHHGFESAGPLRVWLRGD